MAHDRPIYEKAKRHRFLFHLKEIIIQNKDGQKFFYWNHETWVNGSPEGKDGFISDNLTEGMLITIFYTESDKNRIANRIDVETSTAGTQKGWEVPFGCGTSLC